ncbi:MAG: phosphatidylglycerophosphatase A [Bradyrhizobium sp.]|uniref:phosphatidylglycerophosphatase A family protein n=1 Tax=Bradyrhizobium sp. TaxID=376 RepID=UPI002A324C27|nr:phosphatidylglycerophosphatase A [Bradyrhizobium sp.]
MSIDQSDAELDESRARGTNGIALVHYIAATWFGVGRIKFGPGTVATATVLPIYWLLQLAAAPVQLAFVALVVVLAVVCAQWVAADQGRDDPQIIVIDEVAGGLIALLLLNSPSLVPQLAALALFRVLDIYKPWPINLSPSRHAGLNIVYDDVVAGICAGLIVQMVRFA